MNEPRPIGYIENGTVIDHIPSESTLDVVRILGLDSRKDLRASLGWGLDSGSLGKKGVIKIQDRYLAPDEYNLVALVAPNATINTIKDGKVSRGGKIKSEIPKRLEGIVCCTNANCITNDENEQVLSLINYNSKSEKFTCYYCEHNFRREHVKLNLNRGYFNSD